MTPSPFEHPRYRLVREAICREFVLFIEAGHVGYKIGTRDRIRVDLHGKERALEHLDNLLTRAPRKLWGPWSITDKRVFSTQTEARAIAEAEYTSPWIGVTVMQLPRVNQWDTWFIEADLPDVYVPRIRALK